MAETEMLTDEAVQEATRKNLEGKLDDDAIKKFLDATAGLPHIPASASLNFAGIVGWVKCHPTENLRSTVVGSRKPDFGGRSAENP